MRTADYLLGCGLISVALGFGLIQFVIIGVLGVLLVGAALGLLFAGGALARSPGVSRWRAAGGMAVFVVAVLSLLWVGAELTDLAYADARGKQVGRGPVPAARLAVLGLIPVPGVPLAAALRLRGAWPWARCVTWGVAAVAAAPAGALVFLALADTLPLDA